MTRQLLRSAPIPPPGRTRSSEAAACRRLLVADTRDVSIYSDRADLVHRVSNISGLRTTGLAPDGTTMLLLTQKSPGGLAWLNAFDAGTGRNLGELDLTDVHADIAAAIESRVPNLPLVVVATGYRLLGPSNWIGRVGGWIDPASGLLYTKLLRVTDTIRVIDADPTSGYRINDSRVV